MEKMIYSPQGAKFWTDVAGIERWGMMTTRPGTYRVIPLVNVYQYMVLADAPMPAHPTCVVDDFGQLVKVPA